MTQPTYTVIKVHDVGNDVLLIHGIYDPGDHHPLQAIEAHGWVTATINHYDPDNYGEDGHLKEGSEPREMSVEEIKDYTLRLLKEQNPYSAPARKVL